MHRLTAMRTIVVTLMLVISVGAWSTDRKAEASDVDLNGTWAASYSLTCSAAFEQEGDSLSADLDCGSGVEASLAGEIDSEAGMFELSGVLGGLFAIDLEGAVVDGSSLDGTFAAAGLAPAGSFTASRTSGAPDASDLTGEWFITVEEIFSGSCLVGLSHSGADLVAAIECEPPLPGSGVFEGTYDKATARVLLSGAFTETAELVLDGMVSSDGNSIAGTWSVIGLTGTFSATRLSSVTPEPTEGIDAAPMATPAVSLPQTGQGSTSSEGWGIPIWAFLVIGAISGTVAFALLAARPQRGV